MGNQAFTNFDIPTLIQVRNEISARLGDPERRIWTSDVIEKFLIYAQDEYVRKTKILRDCYPLDELPTVSNHNFHFERDHHVTTRRWRPIRSTDRVPTPQLDVCIAMLYAQTSYNFEWERDYVEGGVGPSNVNYPWERDYYYGTITTFLNLPTDRESSGLPALVPILPVDHFMAIAAIPRYFTNVLRLMWNGRRVWPEQESYLADTDRMYETNTGDFDRYTMTKDGLRYLRKYRIPGGRGKHARIYPRVSYAGALRGFMNYDFDQISHLSWLDWTIMSYDALPSPGETWGLLFGALIGSSAAQGWVWSGGPWAGAEVVGRYGVVRRLPKVRVSGGPYGMIRRISFTSGNTVVEANRLARRMVHTTDRFDTPPTLIRFVRDLAQAYCLKMKGPGQSMDVAAFYDSRVEIGVKLALTWLSREHALKRTAYGKNPKRPYPPGRVQWPYHYSGRSWRG